MYCEVGSKFRQPLLAAMLSFTVTMLHADEQNPPLSEEIFWGEIPVVMSATRMSQPVIDSPVAVTVIDRRMIEASGAREIPELFRLVPGFTVGYLDGSMPSVSYHLSQDRYARQMQVMIDGRSVYTTAIGGINWVTLPVTIDDIERIEVVRGPNSASYGANSFLGVINIITRHPLLDEGYSVKTNLGDEGVKEVFLRHGGSTGKFDYRLSAGFVADDGFQDRNDYKRTKLIAMRGEYTLNSTDMLILDTGVGIGPRGVENRSTLKALSPDRERIELHHHQQLRWERSLGLGENLSVQFYHIYQRNFEPFETEKITLGSSGGIDWVVEPIPVDFSLFTHRYDLELQHNANLSEGVQVVWGAGVRDDQVWGGQNLMADVEVHNHLKHAFMNLEWDTGGKWLMNTGVMVEDYETTGTSVSPRAGVSYRFSRAHSLRLTGSKAIRTPSMYEYAARYAYFGPTNYYSGSTIVAPGPDVYQGYDFGTRQTNVERITSYEVGYHGVPAQGKIEMDVKVFRDDLKELLGTQKEPATGDLDGLYYPIVNRDFYLIRGVEFESKFVFDDSNLYFGYARISNDRILRDYVTGEIVTVEDSRRAPKHSFSLLYMMDFDQGYSAGIGYYFTGKIQSWETGRIDRVRDPVRRLDLKAARKFEWLGQETELGLAARNVLGKYEEMEVLRPKSDYPALNEVDPSIYLTFKVQSN